MTTPDESRARADAALEKAREISNKGATIADRWRKSQRDNNFRQMLRAMGRGTANNAP